LKILEGTITCLRPPEPEDLENLYKWENDTDIWQVSNTIVPFSRFTLRKYIETSHLDIYENQQLRFMIDTINEHNTVGTIDLFDFDPYHHRAGIGILIGEDNFREKGYADDALKVLIRYGFNVLMLHQLYCNIGAKNIASIHLFEKNGFKLVGEKREWLRTQEGWDSEYLYQLINLH